MDALIMAAGRGSRLGLHTVDRPKCLIDLGGITPLEFHLDVLAARGVQRVIVVTGYRRALAQEALEHFARGRLETRCVWNPFWPVTNVLASAWFASDELAGDFLYLHGDTLFHPSILDDMLEHGGNAILPIDLRPCEPEQMKANIVSGAVRRLSKELPPDETGGEFIGVARFRKSTVQALKDGMDVTLEQGAFNAYFEEAINWAIEERALQVDPVPTDGRPWVEIDFPDDLELARGIIDSIRER